MGIVIILYYIYINIIKFAYVFYIWKPTECSDFEREKASINKGLFPSLEILAKYFSDCTYNENINWILG